MSERDADDLIHTFGNLCGWSDLERICVLCQHINNQRDNDALADFLQQLADDEGRHNAMNPPGDGDKYADLRTGDECPNCLCGTVEKVEVDGLIEIRCRGECGSIIWDEQVGDYEPAQETCKCGKPVFVSDQTKPGDPAWDGQCGDCHCPDEDTHVGDWRLRCYDKNQVILIEIIIENRNITEAENEARRHPEVQDPKVDDWTLTPIYGMDALLDGTSAILDSICPFSGKAEWVCEDQKIALSEGWDIFGVRGSAQPGDYQIQRYDEVERFDSDLAAWYHVTLQARNGSKPHVRALQFIREHSPEEYKRIVLHVNEGQ